MGAQPVRMGGPAAKSIWTRSGWVAFSVAGLACGLAGAWMRPVWHDELYTLWVARMPLAEMMATLRMDSGPPLHYLLCHVLFLVVGWSEGSAFGTFVVRLPSVLAFAALPWVVWRFDPANKASRFWAPLLTVVWLPMLYFGTEARAYALFALVNGMVWLHGTRLVTAGGPWLGVFAVLAASLPILHYAGIVSLGFLPALALVLPSERRRRFALALGAATIPLLLWSPVLLNAPPESMGWVDTSIGPGRPGLASIEVLSSAGPFPALFEAPEPVVPPLVSMAVLVIGAAAAAFGAWRIITASQDSDRWRSITVPALGITTAVVLGTFALAGVPVYFAGRTESMVWAAVTVLIGSGTALLPRSVRTAALTPYAGLGLITIAMWLADLPSRPPAIGVELGRKLASVIEPNDRIVVVGLWQLEVRHGLAAASQGSVLVNPETLPRSQAAHPGWFDSSPAFTEGLASDAAALEREARNGRSRLWLVWSPLLPIERVVLPTFRDWKHVRAAANSVIVVDLLTLPTGGRPMPD